MFHQDGLDCQIGFVHAPKGNQTEDAVLRGLIQIVCPSIQLTDGGQRILIRRRGIQLPDRLK